jgi:hypothetical protein
MAYAANNTAAVMLFYCPQITLRLAVLRPTFFQNGGVRDKPIFGCKGAKYYLTMQEKMFKQVQKNKKHRKQCLVLFAVFCFFSQDYTQ